MRRAFAAYHPSALPAKSRRLYSRELRGTALLSVGRTAFEGSVLAGIVRVAYDGAMPDAQLNTAVAVLASAPAAANILNFVWARLAHGVDKIHFSTVTELLMAGCIVGLAAMPQTSAGLVGVIAFAFLAWVFWSGYIAVRSTIWRANYARSLRATVASRLATVQATSVGVLSLAIGLLMSDRLGAIMPGLTLGSLGLDPLLVFRWFLVLAAVSTVAGAVVMAGLSVRRHKRLLLAERESSADRTGPTLNPVRVLTLLLEDRRYGAYQLFQSLMGAGNLMLFPLMPIILKERFDAGYFTVLLLTGSLGMLITPLAAPGWARLLDRAHIVRFRAFHSWVFVAAIILLLAASLAGSIWLFALAAMIKGVGLAGGMIAWQIGHHDFAPAAKASEYMGVHVTLTGVRGVFAPFAGVWLYNLIAAQSPALAPLAMLLCLALVLAGAIGFVWMNRTMDLAPADARPPADSRTLGPGPPSRAEA